MISVTVVEERVTISRIAAMVAVPIEAIRIATYTVHR